MQSLEIVLVGQFHQPAELRLDRTKGRRIEQLPLDSGSSPDRGRGKRHGGESGKKCLAHAGIRFQWLWVWVHITTMPVTLRDGYETTHFHRPSTASGR